MPRPLTRRTLLQISTAFAGVRVAAAAGRRPIRVSLLGQSLIGHDLRQQPWPGFDAIATLLRSQDVCFSDLETTIRGPRAEAPTREPAGVHAAEPVVIDCLKAFGINLLATSNNHAFDLGTGGILDTMAALQARNLAFAGTGNNLEAASAAAILDTGFAKVALVSAAAGMIRNGGAATKSRPGVQELRARSRSELHPDDVARMTESIRRAKEKAEIVIAYLHNHLWEEDVAQTADWQRAFARHTIDAGAAVFVAHGPPLLHGIETYRGAPLFHGLGSFIFQTRKVDSAYSEINWQSLIAECRFEAGRFTGAKLRPLILAARGARGEEDLETRGRPSFAEGSAAATVLARIETLSTALGQRLRVRTGFASLDV